MIAKARTAYHLLRCALYQFWLQTLYPGKLVLGSRCLIDYRSRIYILADGKVELGVGVGLRSAPRGYHGGMPFACTVLVDRDGARVRIGDNSRLNGTYVHAQRSISIGKNCVIGAGVNILDSNGHELISVNRTVGRDTPDPVEIGENVWIGLNAVILKGTSIGKNSVVGANTVVKGTFPDNSLIMGNPAQVVKLLQIEAT